MKSDFLIELRDVAVALNGRTVLSGVTWHLRPGQSWAVLGDNGSGKSTFLRLVRAEIAPTPQGGERTYRLDGVSQTTAVGVKERIALVSPEAQDRYFQIEWKLRVRDVIYSGFAGTDYVYERPGAVQRKRAAEIIELLEIASLLRRDIQELSTGELRRVLIARALTGKPQVLLLDEVCDGLDGLTRRKMLGTIGRIIRSGTQVLYTTHRPEEMIPSIKHALVLDCGRMVWCGPAKRLKLMPAQVPVQREASRESGSANILFRLQRVNVYLKRKRVLRNINWEMNSGENWVVFGANGAGKSTFLKLLIGDIHAAFGSVVQRFELTPRRSLWELRRRIGYLSPDLQAIYRERQTGAEVIASGFFSSVGLVNQMSDGQRRRIEELVNEFGAGQLARHVTTELSYGEFRKLLLLRALVHEPEVLLCDEPFDGLDPASKAEFSRVLDHVSRNGTRLVTVTHHLEDLPRSITHALVLEKGIVVCKGEFDRVRKHPLMRSLFGANG